MASNVAEFPSPSQAEALLRICEARVLSEKAKINLIKLAIVVNRNEERKRCIEVVRAIATRKVQSAYASNGPREYIVGVEGLAGDLEFELMKEDQ
jgi:hypothetical protein